MAINKNQVSSENQELDVEISHEEHEQRGEEESNNNGSKVLFEEMR